MNSIVLRNANNQIVGTIGGIIPPIAVTTNTFIARVVEDLNNIFQQNHLGLVAKIEALNKNVRSKDDSEQNQSVREPQV